jgi:hypothetical protein
MRNILLFLLYVLVVTPVGLVWRVVRDPLKRRVDRRAASYWIAAPGLSGAAGEKGVPL